ncbi:MULTISPECIES: HtaA domain-containing protein [unclassified Streptomyces]|uniref:HtaA domain-containing protein n=1 Tax=unclassified Streptomyces TaxID=2593676 RepID=UPI002254CC1D|nr:MULTISPECIES: HtaA domain-containing protein [unclassified Streptomyces]MCX4991327.1 HtaA domain-containing protein [Streptomyces sp. NBC_00568]MCX5003436.1 HtaA domain-containing protein [Streptomyces sp. NBC_00638]
MAANRRRPLALAAAVAVALGAGALAVTSASAAEAPLKDYELTWGIKQSYRSYVTGMAAGSFTPADGATQAAGNGAFTFAGGSGTYDSDTHAVRLGFAGSLKIASKLHGFELTLSDVRFDSGAAEITADVTSGGTTQDDVPLADVTVTRTMAGMETKLTKEAATVLGSASYEGAAGDPLTVVQKPAATPSPTATPTATDSTSPEPSSSSSTSASASPTSSSSSSSSASPSSSSSSSASESASPSASASETRVATRGEIVDGTLGWGVKQSFRTYVVDGAAQGKIAATGGATQAAGNGVFTFTDATGTYDNDADTLSASFEGAVNFKGHEANGSYGLDLTLSGLTVELDGGSGELTADVDSLGETSEDVVLADLSADAADLAARDDVVTLDDVTATLTKAGAKAFGGFYAEGAALDPVDLSVALSEDAQLPDGNGGSGSGSGSGAGGSGGSSGTTTGGVGTTGSTTGGVSGALASTGSQLPAGALGAAAAVTVAAGAGVVFAMRRRRTQ